MSQLDQELKSGWTKEKENADWDSKIINYQNLLSIKRDTTKQKKH